MTPWASRITFFLNIIVLVCAVLYFGLHPLLRGKDGIDYKDLITIILTAIAVLLAAVTLFVAAMAIWGYNSIREASVRAAVEAAEVEATKVAKDTASVVASREAMGILQVLRGGGEPETENELADALRSSDAQS